MSEDCLYLNVWSPPNRPATACRSGVDYGGGFGGGATSIRHTAGSSLPRGRVLVSIAYVLGRSVSSPSDLSAETRNRASGNYGLLDMIAGLRWIQKSIAAFGAIPGG